MGAACQRGGAARPAACRGPRPRTCAAARRRRAPSSRAARCTCKTRERMHARVHAARHVRACRPHACEMSLSIGECSAKWPFLTVLTCSTRDGSERWCTEHRRHSGRGASCVWLWSRRRPPPRGRGTPPTPPAACACTCRGQMGARAHTRGDARRAQCPGCVYARLQGLVVVDARGQLGLGLGLGLVPTCRASSSWTHEGISAVCCESCAAPSRNGRNLCARRARGGCTSCHPHVDVYMLHMHMCTCTCTCHVHVTCIRARGACSSMPCTYW